MLDHVFLSVRDLATDNGAPGARLYYDPRYYAANIFDPNGYSIEVVYKSWQHAAPPATA